MLSIRMDNTSPAVREDLESVVNLAIQRQQAGDLSAAEVLYGRVLSIKPDHAVCLHNLGSIRHQRGDLPAALELVGTAARLKPRDAQFRCSLGVLRNAAGDFPGAIASLREAIALRPDYPLAWEALGEALANTGQTEDAIRTLQHALSLNHGSRPARGHLYNLLRDHGRWDEAEELLREPLDANPLDADYVVKRGMARLGRGDHAGWKDYAWSHWSPEWLRSDLPVLVPLPQWDGQRIGDEGLLLYGEQGIGDEIMFSRLLPLASARVERMVLLCEPRLAPLFTRSFPHVTVAPKPPGGQPALLAPDLNCKWRCSLSRLPAVLEIAEQDIPGAATLRADPEATTSWRRQLQATGARLLVGLSWRGGANDRTRALRSVPLATLAPLFAIPGVRFVSVQHGSHAEEIAAFNAVSPQPLLCLEEIDPLRDMDGLASLLAALDCVVSVDNSTAHLAGALGVPTLMMCPFNADWRWMKTREDSPWYDSLRLIRQRSPGNDSWRDVVERIGSVLRDMPARGSTDVTALRAAGTRASHAPAPAPTALLINDTTFWYHWGCSGTSLALHAGLRQAGHVVDSVPIMIVNRLDPLPGAAADLDDPQLFERFRQRNPALIARLQAVREVIINGEGSIHGMGRTPRALLYLAWLARQRFGKRTSIVNHSCYPESDRAPGAAEFYARVYRAMDFVAVRESCSAAELSRLAVPAAQSFDCLPLFIAGMPVSRPTQSGRRIVLAGSVFQGPALVELLAALGEFAIDLGYEVDVLVGAAAFIAADDVRLMAALHPRLRGRYRLIAATSERQWLEAIAAADLVVSGRFHHSIAAACLGTPFLVTASNTRKIDGLIERLGLRQDEVWITAADPAQARSRLAAMLEDPGRGRVSGETLARLRELAQRNFSGPGTGAIR